MNSPISAPHWPQRPGWQSAIDLVHAEIGTKVDLAAMPLEGVARRLASWTQSAGREMCVVHTDHNADNVRIAAHQMALVDWDEAHVDVFDLDLMMPHNAAGGPGFRSTRLGPAARQVGRRPDYGADGMGGSSPSILPVRERV